MPTSKHHVHRAEYIKASAMDPAAPQPQLPAGWQANLQRVLSDVVPLLSAELAAPACRWLSRAVPLLGQLLAALLHRVAVAGRGPPQPSLLPRAPTRNPCSR